MTIADLCLPVMIILIIATIAVAKADGGKQYDNANPRDPGFYKSGLRARAQAAHLNGYEAFPFFAAAVILAEFRAAPQTTVNTLAVAFILIRIAYVALYLTNRPSARSVVWILGFACNLALFFTPVWAGG
jgi:uncharacterized MAPEG superfamily protein